MRHGTYFWLSRELEWESRRGLGDEKYDLRSRLRPRGALPVDVPGSSNNK